MAKCIAIYLVVCGHVASSIVDKPIVLIDYCHMPLFFFISGYFMSSRCLHTDLKTIVKKKLRTLFIPYLCWSFISYVANILMKVINSEISINTAFLDDGGYWMSLLIYSFTHEVYGFY